MAEKTETTITPRARGMLRRAANLLNSSEREVLEEALRQYLSRLDAETEISEEEADRLAVEELHAFRRGE